MNQVLALQQLEPKKDSERNIMVPDETYPIDNTDTVVKLTLKNN
ncbi:class III lanthipeptide [Chengkuizengella marina]|nr:class III lanthipeptide [Chengkuizengella marina]